jgi:hypothetical protein
MQELLGFIDERYAEFRTTVEAVPDDARERRPAEGRWTVAEVVDHVSRVETVLAMRFEQWVAEMRANGASQETETGSILDPALIARLRNRETALSAPERAYPRADVTFVDAWQAFEAAHAKARAAVAAADGLALGSRTEPHPALGPLTLYEWGIAAAGHEARHAAQIRETAAALAQSGGMATEAAGAGAS